MSRESQYAVRIALDDVDTGIWDKMEGGARDSEESKYKPGGMQPEISLGGQQTVENITVSRLYVLDRDHAQWVGKFLNRVGRGKVTVTKQPLDIDGNVFGDPIVYTGILKTVTPPDVDSESDDASLWSFEVTPSGTIHTGPAT
jgi:hypothetical protein